VSVTCLHFISTTSEQTKCLLYKMNQIALVILLSETMSWSKSARLEIHIIMRMTIDYECNVWRDLICSTRLDDLVLISFYSNLNPTRYISHSGHSKGIIRNIVNRNYFCIVIWPFPIPFINFGTGNKDLLTLPRKILLSTRIKVLL